MANKEVHFGASFDLGGCDTGVTGVMGSAARAARALLEALKEKG